MQEITYDTATTATGKGRFFIIDKIVSDGNKKEFSELVKIQTTKKGKVKKVWQVGRFERKCK